MNPQVLIHLQQQQQKSRLVIQTRKAFEQAPKNPVTARVINNKTNAEINL